MAELKPAFEARGSVCELQSHLGVVMKIQSQRPQNKLLHLIFSHVSEQAGVYTTPLP